MASPGTNNLKAAFLFAIAVAYGAPRAIDNLQLMFTGSQSPAAVKGPTAAPVHGAK